ncbi:DUF6475 domain-containing protein [Salinisphaera sp. G21_0]|uniref:DUF6475 domain-containing protein n=1 Tax=Salinisphaera sp. G21_0 TaxID=2821094 RepID=UPI001ADC54EF|nr:DUF6475 domain-containing protein [Salinisphaera sp. G21_0]MBO9484339.1 hypothetical protein [Salinisphaera sp. G21_0]
MDTNNPQEVKSFIDLMTGVAEYYGKELSPAGMRILMNALAVYPISDIQRACSTHVRNPDSGQFMPKAGDIVRLIEGDTGSQAGQAGVKVDKALRIQGPYVDVCFDDPIIHRVIEDMGGWVHYCTRSNEDEYVFQQKEFERRYKGYVGRPLQEYPKLLTGMASHSNSVKGFQREELPKLIGNQEKAFLVYQNGIEPGAKQSGPVDFSRMIADMRAGTTPALPNKTSENGGGNEQAH